MQKEGEKENDIVSCMDGRTLYFERTCSEEGTLLALGTGEENKEKVGVMYISME